MLDAANTAFVNDLVTFVRYAAYAWLWICGLYAAGWLAYHAVFRPLRKLWQRTFESDQEHGRRKMRDLGY